MFRKNDQHQQSCLCSAASILCPKSYRNDWMYDHFCYDVQVRYALGYRDLSEGHFELRTVYNFRQRVARQMQEAGQNLIEQTFEQVTDEQIAAFELKTGKLRMDSTQIVSNIRKTVVVKK